jgi:ATP-dependent protease HslVU (ClpYQ) ATPase subunit
MRRALVLGSSGSGKSTFARRLSQITGVPMVSIDAVYWQPGWCASDPESFEASMTQIAGRPSWVRPEMAEGCPERFDLEFIRYVRTYRAQRRPKVSTFSEGLRPDQDRIRFTNRSAAGCYLASHPSVVGGQ